MAINWLLVAGLLATAMAVYKVGSAVQARAAQPRVRTP